MKNKEFTATLLRASASGIAGMTASELADPDGSATLEGGFDAWKAHVEGIVLELAAAVEDGGPASFGERIGWTRDAFVARRLDGEAFRAAFTRLSGVLETSLPDEAFGGLRDFLQRGRDVLAGESTETRGSDPVDGAVREAVDAYVARIRAGDMRAALEDVVSRLDRNELTVADVLNDVVPSALRRVGQLWHSDEISVAEEHFATHTTGRLLDRVALTAPRADDNGRTVVLAMAEGDAHDLGLRLVALVFELDGWRTICFGANTPATDLARAVETFAPDLIVLGATPNTQRESVAATVEILRQPGATAPILIGGPAFAQLPGRAREIGADGWAVSPADALRVGTELVAS